MRKTFHEIYLQFVACYAKSCIYLFCNNKVTKRFEYFKLTLPRVSMVIEKEMMDLWKKLRSEADSKIIAQRAGVTPVTIQSVFRTGKANDNVFAIMADYYAAKANEVKKAAEKLAKTITQKSRCLI